MDSRRPSLIELARCELVPPCGGPVVVGDEAAHRRWHERVYITEPVEGDPDWAPPRRKPRFIGEPDEGFPD